MSIDERALQAVEEFKEEEDDYHNDSQRYAALQVLMISLMEEQHELTKLACCEAIKHCEDADSHTRVRRHEAMGACLEVRAP